MNLTLPFLRARSRAALLLSILLLAPWLGRAQNQVTAIGTLPSQATLQQCVEFALRNQPLVRQSQLNEQIGERNIRIGLSYWLPQVNGTGSYTRNIQLPTSVLPNFTDPSAGQQIVRIGLKNSSTLGLGATQLLYSNDVLLAARSVRATRLNYSQTTTLNKIDVVTNVSKAFYDILLTQEQLRILAEDILRQERQVKDARAQFEQGIVDKTDFLRASISVKNAYAQRRTTAESMKGKYATLKQLM
ncbi:MAG TPA: TolC family protein, partial [Hymenobacter sp.]